MRPDDLIFYGGGECLQRFGVPFWRRTRAQDVAVTFTRSGTVGSAEGPDGRLRGVIADRLRTRPLDLDGDGEAESLGLIVESALQTFCVRNQTPSVSWGSVNTTWTADDAEAPDGTVTADLLTADTGAAAVHYAQAASLGQILFAPDDTDNVWSIYLADAGYPEAKVGILGRDNVFRGVWFNLELGTVGAADSGAAGYIDSSVVVGARTYYRCVVVVTVGSGATGDAGRVYIGAGGETDTFVGNGSSGILVWGGQDEAERAYATSYAGEVVTADITRPDETLWAPFPFAPSEVGAIYLKFPELGAIATNLSTVLHIGNAAGDQNRIDVLVQSSRYRLYWQTDSGEDQTGSGLAIPSVRQTVELCGSFLPDGSLRLEQRLDFGSIDSVTSAGSEQAPAELADQRIYFGSAGTVRRCPALNLATVAVAREPASLADMAGIYS